MSGPWCELCPDAPLNWSTGGRGWVRCTELGHCGRDSNANRDYVTDEAALLHDIRQALSELRDVQSADNKYSVKLESE